MATKPGVPRWPACQFSLFLGLDTEHIASDTGRLRLPALPRERYKLDPDPASSIRTTSMHGHLFSHAAPAPAERPLMAREILLQWGAGKAYQVKTRTMEQSRSSFIHPWAGSPRTDGV